MRATLRRYSRTKPPTSRTPLPPSQPEQPQESPVQWKLIRLDSPPWPLTRPPRDLLTTWDVRLRRYTSPRYSVPPLLSPLPLSPGDFHHQGTQTLPPSRVHRGLQVQPPTSGTEVQTDSEWEAPTVDKGTQAYIPSPSGTQATQTEESELEESGTTTPPGTPPAWRRPGPGGNRQALHRTHTRPCLLWSERLH